MSNEYGDVDKRHSAIFDERNQKHEMDALIRYSFC